MNDIEALASHPDISASFDLPEGAKLTFIVEKSRGAFIQRHDVGVYVEGQRTGTLYLWDAVTFRQWKYAGKDPRDLTKDFENWGSLPLPRDPEIFYQRFEKALELKAQNELRE